MDEYLTQVYYNPKRSGGLGGVERLYRDVKKDGKYDISSVRQRVYNTPHATRVPHAHCVDFAIIPRRVPRVFPCPTQYAWWMTSLG